MTALRKDIYDPTIKKYLVLVRDDVESAEEKLQELQQELSDMGLFSSDFELGDVLQDLDNDGNEDEVNKNAVRKKVSEWPTIEGDESVAEYLGQYRRAVLSRKALLKNGKERLEKEGGKGYECLACNLCELRPDIL